MRLPASIAKYFPAALALSALVALSGCTSKAEVLEVPRSAIVAHPQAAANANAEVYSGDVRARYESQLGFRVAGKIKTRQVDVGAHVEAGQTLAELDPQDAHLQVASARATLASAQADLTLATSERERYRALLDKHLISQSQYDAKDSTLKAAAARADEARAALAVAQNQAEYTTLRADHAGVITAISGESGQVVVAGQAVAMLARDGAFEVEIAMPENRIAAYRVNQPATVELWAESGKRLTGHLREIAPEADRTTRTYRVRVSLDAAATAPKLGQTARVYFVDADQTEQHLIPLSALYEKDGNPAVWLVDPNTRQVHLAPVAVIAYREQGVTLGAGVSEGQWIVTAGVHKLHDGQAIVPVDRNNRLLTL